MAGWLGRLMGRTAARGDDPVAPATASLSAPPVGAPVRAAPPLDVDTEFHRWLLDVEPHVERPVDGRERALFDALRASVGDERLASRVPRVPAIVPQLMQMLRDPSRETTDVARHVEQDPVLVASVLRVANSPWFGAGRRIDSVEHAVLILGHDGLRQLVANVAMKPLINVQSGHYTRAGAPRVWIQSERAGAACRLLARSYGANGFESYLGVLLLNMGTIVALRVMDEHYRDGDRPGSRDFCMALVDVVRDLAQTIGRQWEFPARVLATLAPSTNAPVATLVRTAERVSRLRVLTDAQRVAPECARDSLISAAAVLACFDTLGAKSAA
jgi:HD-like signal output (HDOD) protein